MIKALLMDYLGIEGAIGAKTVTCDFACLMDGAKQVSCSAFGEATIEHM
ncbi:MAG TPA: hypothetical protein VIH29_09820 [Gallionella sp.]